MGLPLNEPLLEQARALLDRCHGANPEPSEHPALLELALACHRRMLELGDTHRPAAVALAIAGADLLQALQRHTPAGSTVPDWVLVHEEQCCRYGAIWIHAEAEASEELPPAELERGLHFLDRLEQFHQAPPSWIAVYRSDLQNQLRSPAAPEHQRIVVVGNCQAHPLMLGLRAALPEASIHFCPSVHLATEADVGRLHGRLGSADILITHRITPGYRNNIGLDSPTLRSLLPQKGKTFVLPNLHYEGHHPWIGYAQLPSTSARISLQDSPLGDYHDFLAMVAAAEDRSPEQLLHTEPTGRIHARLQEVHQESLRELQAREADCDLQISDWIEEQHRARALMHTINHPTQALLHELLQRLLRRMGRPEAWIPEAADHQEHLGGLSIPIHPWVGEALDPEDWHRHWGQREGSRLAIEQQLRASMAFYARHPWILEANRSHPKAVLAAELLSALREEPAIGATATPAISAQQARSAAIGYHFLDPRHGFQLPGGLPSRPLKLPSWEPPLHTYRIGWRLERQALVLPVGVITAEGWLSDCVQYLPPQWSQAAWMQSMGGYRLLDPASSDKEQNPAAPPTLSLIDEEGTPEHPLQGRWCVLNDIVAHRNFAHFFHDLLPQLMAIRKLRQEWPELQVMGSVERHPNLRLLRELVLEGGWQPRPPHHRLRVEELVLQPLAFNGGGGFHANPSPHWWLAADDLRDGLEWLRRKLAPEASSLWRGHWLCFSRDLHLPTEAPQGRIFSNYAHLLERLSNTGVLIVDPGRHTIGQLQLLVAAARGFIGIHGSGLYNALLGEEGARVIEIRPACGCWRTVELFSQVAGLRWHAVACTPDPNAPERSAIPIDAVLSLIE